MKIRQTVAFLFLCTAFGAQAATSSIGFITAQGSFQLDQSKIWGNATLFDGSVVETKVAPSKIHLSNGSEIQLAAESKARFFQGRAVIEKGAMRLQTPAGYLVEARSFHISTSAANTVAGLQLRGAAGLAASAASGQLLITNSQGVLVADLADGKGVTLTPEPGAVSAVTKLTGCLVPTKGSFLLKDQASNVTFLVHGSGIEAEAGNRIEITGTTEHASAKTAGASQVINVSQVKRLEAGVCKATASHKGPLGAVAGAIGGTIAGVAAAAGTAGAVAIISGVVVAGTVGGLDAAGAFARTQADVQPATSR